MNTDGEVDILVQWRGHDDTNNTWEPIQQLVCNMSTMVVKYVKDNVGWATWTESTKSRFVRIRRGEKDLRYRSSR